MLSSEGSSFSYKHAGAERERFYNGSTISRDGHPGMHFDFCISNPPFGTPWKEDLKAWGLSDTEIEVHAGVPSRLIVEPL